VKYADAGVDIEKAEKAMSSIKKLVKSTYTPSVEADFGNFGGLFSLGNLNMKDPILVSSVDGVGTKIKIGIDSKRYSCPGQDIVNHCVGDILVQGAKPLFFLDYYATGVLEEEALVGVVEGLAKACKENGCALLGGETAEMPGIYQDGDFDLAGTIVGVVDREHLIDGSRIEAGDVLIGLPSSGLHTNGYSLARKVLFEKMGYKLSDQPGDLERSLEDVLVEPHRSYLKPLYPLVEEKLVNGMVHITGGGFPGNIPRVLPEGLAVTVDTTAWKPPAIYSLIQKDGEVDKEEMYKTFNMGIGMILIVSKDQVTDIQEKLRSAGESCHVIGEVTQKEAGVERVVLK
jgi:phosphoribosylformylglycinamidine cyclo-ligase